jgi:AbiU2
MADVSANVITAMGPELGLVFNALWNDAVELHHRWNEYVALFGKGTGRIKILNDSASSFFGLIQRDMWHQTLLQISRMTDPPKSVGKLNVSLSRLPALVRGDLKDEIESLVEVSKQKAAFAKDWRNRSLAHSDHELAIEKSARPLSPASNSDVEAVLEAIGACLNAVDVAYRDTTTWWKPVSPMDGADTLLYILRAGDAAKQKELSMLLSDEIGWEDEKFWDPLP